VNLNLTAAVGIHTSYQIASRNILNSLTARGYDVNLVPIGELSGYSEDGSAISKGLYNQDYFDRNAPSLKIWHEYDQWGHVGKGLRIGYVFFELDRFPQNTIRSLKSLDGIFVASEWARQVILSNEIKVPTYVVPLGTDRSIFNEEVSLLIPKGKTLRFINVGKFEHRKGHQELIECFNKAFSRNDDVELLLCWNNPFVSPEDFNQLKLQVESTPLGNKIKFLPRVGHPSELSQIMASCDCLVSPSRSEGWNLPMMDALSMGMDVIATNYSAPTEYLTDKNSLLIEPTGLEIADDGVWFKSGIGSWMSFGAPQKEQLISHMRTIHQKKKNNLLGVNMNGVMTGKRFSWGNTVSRITESLKELNIN